MKLPRKLNLSNCEPPKTLIHIILGKQRIKEIGQEFGLTEQEETILDELLIALENSINSGKLMKLSSIKHLKRLTKNRKIAVASALKQIAEEYALISS
jgi:hypothetical protein